MLVVDTETIRNEIFIQRLSGLRIAKMLKISQSSFYKKINGKRDFTASEIGALATILKKEVNFFYKNRI